LEEGGESRVEAANTNWVSDEDLMLEVRNGGTENVGVLFDRYEKPLLNFYAKLTGNRTLSEDLVQEVFLRLLKYRASYDPGTPFRAWVYTIARNARVDHFRKQRPETSWEPHMSPAVVPADAAQQQQETDLLHRALMQLSEDKREVLVLSRFQDMKYEEIAKLLGCEVGTVKTRVYRALQDLKQIFSGLKSSGGKRAAGMVPPMGVGNEL
jgi:RNA polymerase sigma factor (sigma-70 family)